MDLHTAINGFLNDVTARALSPKTHQRYAADLADLERFLQQHAIQDIEQVTADLLRTYFGELQNRKNIRRPGECLSPFTIEGMFRTAKTFFRWLEWDEVLLANPMRRVRRPRMPDRIVPRLNKDQIDALLNEVKATMSPERNLALLLLMVDSGLRRGEAIGLTVTDVHLDERRVHVFGKGRKERDVPLGDAMTQALRIWLSLRPPSDCSNVFVNADGNPLKPAAVRSLLARLQTRLGLRRLYPHLLRHSFAERYLELTNDAKTLQLILGHSKSSTTLDLYVHPDFAHIRKMHQQGSPADDLMKNKNTAENCRV